MKVVSSLYTKPTNRANRTHRHTHIHSHTYIIIIIMVYTNSLRFTTFSNIVGMVA